MIKDLIKQLPSVMGDHVQYYYRRGSKFFFRTTDNTKFFILVSNDLVEECKKELKINETYNTK